VQSGTLHCTISKTYQFLKDMETTSNKQDFIELSNVNIGMLRALFKRSLLCDSKLGFELDMTNGSLSSLAGGSSFFKKWSEPIANFAQNITSTVKTSVKVFVFDGSKFVDRVLSNFDNTATITILCDNVQGEHVAKQVVVSSPMLTIRTVCGLLRLGYVQLKPEEHRALFENTTNLRKLELTSQQINTLSRFGSLNMLGKSVEGIELRTNQKGLVASDGSFEFVLDPNYQYDLQPITIHKSLLRFIDDNESYEVRITTMQTGTDIMTLKSKEHDLIMTMALIVNVSPMMSNFDVESDDDDLPF
jgi:hypothetical protein